MNTIIETRLKGVFSDNRRRLYTKNLVPGATVYTEDLVVSDGVEYREWNPKKSKLAAGIVKGISQIGMRPGSTVLYLGCASGTTSSHVSDLIDKEGFVFCVDISARVLRQIVPVCAARKNMTPLLADANNLPSFAHQVISADVVFQDVAQKNQAEIFLKNCDAFLKKGGFGILCIKARSIDVARHPKEIFKEIRAKLEKKVMIVDYRELDPLEKDHCLFVCKKV